MRQAIVNGCCVGDKPFVVSIISPLAATSALKRKCRHFDKIFVTGCTERCQNDNVQCSQWRKCHQNDNIFVSVWWLRLMTHIQITYMWYRSKMGGFDRNISEVNGIIRELALCELELALEFINIFTHTVKGCHSVTTIWQWPDEHYSDVIMSTMESRITSLTILYSTIYSGANQRKHQSSASLAFVRGIHRSSVNSPHKGPVTRKMFPFDDDIMLNQSARLLSYVS